jgi:hypothetical protein
MTAGARARERLYAVAPKDFTRARNTLAAELRQAHDRAAPFASGRAIEQEAAIWVPPENRV